MNIRSGHDGFYDIRPMGNDAFEVALTPRGREQLPKVLSRDLGIPEGAFSPNDPFFKQPVKCQQDMIDSSCHIFGFIMALWVSKELASRYCDQVNEEWKSSGLPFRFDWCQRADGAYLVAKKEGALRVDSALARQKGQVLSGRKPESSLVRCSRLIPRLDREGFMRDVLEDCDAGRAAGETDNGIRRIIKGHLCVMVLKSLVRAIKWFLELPIRSLPKE